MSDLACVEDFVAACIAAAIAWDNVKQLAALGDGVTLDCRHPGI